MGADTTDNFQKELVDLFVQEAHEWLQNIHVALDELQQAPAPEQHAKLIEKIVGGVTNLGGSAATINLSEVQQASFAAIPFIDALRDPKKAFAVQDFFSLCKQLGQIHTALTRATGLPFEDSGGSATDEVGRARLSPAAFLHALQELLVKQSPSIVAGRNLIESMIKQMEGQIHAGVECLDVTVIQGYLARASEAEESFLIMIEERVPEIFKKLSALMIEENELSSRITALEVSLQDVAHLRAEAQQVNAGSAMMFFTGLHSLLTVVAQRRIVLAASRVESVKARLRGMGDAIRQWAEHGRIQRAAINQLLFTSRS